MKHLKNSKGHLEYVQPKAYVSGEMQFYLGRRYVLKVVEDHHAIRMSNGTRQRLVTLQRFHKQIRIDQNTCL